MKHYAHIFVLLTLSSLVFADDMQKNMKEMDEKLKEMDVKGKEFHNNLFLSMESFCSKGSNIACESKKKWLEQKNNPDKVQTPDPAMKKSLEDGLKMSQKCNNDATCMKKALTEEFTKQAKEYNSKCAAGDQDSCFAHDQSKLLHEWSIYSMESMETMKKMIK